MVKNRIMTDKLEMFIDNQFIKEVDDPIIARDEFWQWFMKTPFWETTSCFIYIYKDIDKNKMYEKPKFEMPKESEERNLFFMEDNNPYVCLRCRRPSEIVGFCGVCYDQIYGIDESEEIEVPMEDINCHPRFIEVVEADPDYTSKIKKSMEKEGMRNPLVLDRDNVILIGHHRYFIAKQLGWKTIRCKYNNIKFNHGYFYEGKGYNVFVVRIDGELFMNTTCIDDVTPIILDFFHNNMGKTFELEAFLNAGSDIRLRNVFIPERGDVVDPTWHDWYIRKFNKKPKIGKFS